MSYLFEILSVANVVFMSYFLVSGTYLLVFAVSSHLRRKAIYSVLPEAKYDLAVIIPAYKEDSVIISSAIAAKNHQSQLTDKQVIVVADSLQPETVMKLKDESIEVLEVSFENSTKVKSINASLAFLPDTTDFVIVLDADNVMKVGAVDELVRSASNGYRVVQGHRIAKNMNTSFAMLDALSEEINNTIFRKGHKRVGLSAALIGSGFLADFRTFREMMNSIEAVGGFDKELELKLFKSRIKIGYAEDAIIYDEKVQRADHFYHQRRRWISAQLIYLMKNWYRSFVELFRHSNVDYFDKVLQFALPPRILSIGIPFMLTVSFFLASLFMGLNTDFAVGWALAFFFSLAPVLLSVPSEMWSKKVMNGLQSLPAGFFMMLKALFTFRGANKRFIHTPHGELHIKIEK